MFWVFFFQAEDGIRDDLVTGVQTCALPICAGEAEGLGAAARDLGRRDARPLRDERPGKRASLLRDLRRDALHRHGEALVRRRRARPLPRGRLRDHVPETARAGADNELALALVDAQDLLP